MQGNNVVGSRAVFSNERPAYPVYPPAVIRHVQFRIRGSSDKGLFDEAEQKQRSLAMRNCLAKHLNAVRDAFGPSESQVEIVSDAADADDKLRFSPNRTIFFEVTSPPRYEYRLRVRADIYSELFTVSYLIDQINTDGSGTIARHLARLPREPEAIDWLFNEVWGSSDFPAGPLIRNWTLPHDRADSNREVGELVADFRTVILYPRAEWEMQEPSLEFSRIAISNESQIAPELLAFASEHQKLIRRVTGTNTENAGGEPVVCGMAGGQALYAAELGQWALNGQSITPIRLLLVYAGHSDAQLGRLMRRLHVVGELRHAAVLDWDLSALGRKDDLQRASSSLRALSTKVDDATLDSTMEKVREILPDFARINMGTEGGLSYRIERSRSYAESFLSMIPHLRITRIAGWQPYDDFVNRYIHLLFGRIDRIGLQYDELGSRLDRLMYYEQAKSLDEYQGKVRDELVGLRSLMARLEKINKKQEDLLRDAEYIAVVFMIYYVGSIYYQGVKEDPTFLNAFGIKAVMSHDVWFLSAAIIAVPISGILLIKIIKNLITTVVDAVRGKGNDLE